MSLTFDIKYHSSTEYNPNPLHRSRDAGITLYWQWQTKLELLRSPRTTSSNRPSGQDVEHTCCRKVQKRAHPRIIHLTSSTGAPIQRH